MWSVTFVTAGYFLGRQWTVVFGKIRPTLMTSSIIIVTLCLLYIAGQQFLRERKSIERVTAKVEYFFWQQSGTLRFLRCDMEQLFPKLRIVHLSSVPRKLSRVFALIDIALAQNVESHAVRFVADA